jgi:predicted negative regulator of RcsB-dependent stress response
MDWINTTAILIAFLLSAFNLWDRVDARKKAAQEPTKKLESRVEVLEDLVKNEYESRFKSDLRRIEILEEGNRVTQKALLALLAHARDGNNTKQLEDAENDLKEYLINR